MNKATLDAAEMQAREFLIRVEALKADAEAMRWMGICGGKATSAVRRQSMELTRALADLRRPL